MLWKIPKGPPSTDCSRELNKKHKKKHNFNFENPRRIILLSLAFFKFKYTFLNFSQRGSADAQFKKKNLKPIKSEFSEGMGVF